MKNFVFLLLLILSSLSACKTEENILLSEKVDFSELNVDNTYEVGSLEGFAKLTPYNGGVVLTLQGKKENGNHSFVLQSETPLLEKEKILGEGKVYWRIPKERAQMYRKAMPHTHLTFTGCNVIYFEGKEQLSLQVTGVEPGPAIALEQNYEGYGLAHYTRVVNVSDL